MRRVSRVSRTMRRVSRVSRTMRRVSRGEYQGQ